LQIAGSSLGITRSEETRAKTSASMLGNSNGIKQAQKIEVLDLKLNTTTTYISFSEAARALNILHSGISNYFSRNQRKPYKGRYVFSITKI
jgi:hypothetical protein